MHWRLVVSLQKIRLKMVFFLLILLLLLASAIFGVLTYWLGGESRPLVGPREEDGAFSPRSCRSVARLIQAYGNRVLWM